MSEPKQTIAAVPATRAIDHAQATAHGPKDSLPDAPDRYAPSPVAELLALLVRGYQVTLSPYFGTQCRFFPTCSEYSRQALLSHGAVTGSWLTMRRLCKCHPWHPGGFDPVP